MSFIGSYGANCGPAVASARGNLNNASTNTGASAFNANNAVSNTNWNYGSRLTVYNQCTVRRRWKTAALRARPETCPAGEIESRAAELVGNERSVSFNRNGEKQMKRNGREYDITNPDVIYPWAFECLCRHRRRHDFRKFLVQDCGMSGKEYRMALTDKQYLQKPAMTAAKMAAGQIKEHKLDLPPVKVKRRVDKSSFKVRDIGCEPPLQQILDYVAVYGAMPIFKRRISPNQASSMKKRGPTYGVRKIAKWIKKDNGAAEYAQRHHGRYVRQCRYYVKLDIHRCFPSIRSDVFMDFFSRDCNNEDLTWLWTELLESHHINGYEGLMIGALPSQWAAQYIMSYIYRYLMSLHYFRRERRFKSVSHGLTYMDDILACGPNRKELERAAEQTERFVQENFKMSLKHPWHIQRLDETPIDIMGYVIHADGNVVIRPRVFLRARRVALRIKRRGRMSLGQARRIVAYKGYFFQKGIAIKSFRPRRKYDLDAIFRQAQQTISIHDKRKARSNNGLHIQGQTASDPDLEGKRCP